jgi:hypothetical protein
MKKTFEYCIPTHDGEYWRDVDAYDEEDAAHRAAAEFNEGGDYSLMNSYEYVLVRKDEDSTIKVFHISAEQSIDYHAYEIDDVKCRHCGKDLTSKIIEGTHYSRESHDYCSYECFKLWYNDWYAEYKKGIESYERKNN